ncbi:VOC family protein [Devosia sp. 2618]|uniref:VOC family protein n=1 Tax=Devosia sp. 2618 TaxID=3156454 RepID=UPI003390CBB5
MSQITPCLWLDDRIDEAIKFYTETFKSAKVHQVVRQAPDQPAFSAIIELEGSRFMLLSGNPNVQFTQTVSFMIECKDQKDVDYFWDALSTNGGKESVCGWCEDRFGLSWQVTPKQIYDTVLGKDPVGAQRAVQAMMGMKKLIIADLQKAYDGN